MITDIPPAWGEPLVTAQLKQQPSDFVVNEVLDIDFEDSGEHLYLHIEKTGANTDEIAKLLETTFSVNSKDIGLAGLKDRHAITRQWFSVRTASSVDEITQALEIFNHPEKHARVVNCTRHSRKLRRGAHRGNDFVIRLRDVKTTEGGMGRQSLAAAVERRVGRIVRSGFPNYIGPQRFGFGGQNLVRARQWFRQPRKRTSRQQRSLWLSSARSALFNLVCASRVADGSWQTLLPGEPAVLSGSRSFFDSDSSTTDELSQRLNSFDIHPSAPWWGRGTPPAQGACADYELLLLAEHADLCEGLERAGLPQERRAIRSVATDLRHQWLDDTTFELSFHLSPGVFATTLLREFGLCHEPDRR